MSLILSGTDGLSDVDGSAATPAIRGTDANTGIFFPAADTIAFAEGGAEVARFDSAGSFGIGTATPYRQFQVGNYSTNAIMALGSSPTSTGTLVFASADSAPGRYVGSIDYNHTSNYLSFTTNASERARFNSTGAFVLAGGTTTANGIGITFPATQSASSDANTLDDYEEGTWTPALANVTVTYASRTGTYTKIGNRVTLFFTISLASLSGSGTLWITGNPFTPSGDDGDVGGVMGTSGLASLSASFCASLNADTNVYLYTQGASSRANWTHSNITASSVFSGTIVYKTA